MHGLACFISLQIYIFLTDFGKDAAIGGASVACHCF